MPGPHSAQLYAFALFVLTGMGLGFSFDVYRAARAVFRPGPAATAVADVLFALLAGALAGGMLWLANWGEPRLYLLFAAIAGLASYAGLASATVLLMANACWRGVALVLRPVVAVWRWLGRLLARLWQLLLGLWPDDWLGADPPEDSADPPADPSGESDPST